MYMYLDISIVSTPIHSNSNVTFQTLDTKGQVETVQKKSADPRASKSCSADGEDLHDAHRKVAQLSCSWGCRT